MKTSKEMNSVSTLALASAALATGMAQQAAAEDYGYSLTLIGGYGNSEDGAAELFGETQGQSPFGAIVLSQEFGAFDASFSLLRYNQANMYDEVTFGGSSSGGAIYVDDEVSFTRLDATVSVDLNGRTGLPIEVFAGLSALDYNLGVGFGGETYSYGESSGFSTNGNASFQAAGPRIGMRYSSGPIGGSRFGFTAEAGAAMLRGNYEEAYSFNTYATSGGSFAEVGVESSYSDTRTVTALDFALRANYYFTDATTLFVGFETMELLDLSDLSDGFGRTSMVTVGFSTDF